MAGKRHRLAALPLPASVNFRRLGLFAPRLLYAVLYWLLRALCWPYAALPLLWAGIALTNTQGRGLEHLLVGLVFGLPVWWLLRWAVPWLPRPSLRLPIDETPRPLPVVAGAAEPRGESPDIASIRRQLDPALQKILEEEGAP